MKYNYILREYSTKKLSLKKPTRVEERLDFSNLNLHGVCSHITLLGSVCCLVSVICLVLATVQVLMVST